MVNEESKKIIHINIIKIKLVKKYVYFYSELKYSRWYYVHYIPFITYKLKIKVKDNKITNICCITDYLQ